jgi:hypothetical protein
VLGRPIYTGKYLSLIIIHTQHTRTYSKVRFLGLYKICLCVYTHMYIFKYLKAINICFLIMAQEKSAICNYVLFEKVGSRTSTV